MRSLGSVTPSSYFLMYQPCYVNSRKSHTSTRKEKAISKFSFPLDALKIPDYLKFALILEKFALQMHLKIGESLHIVFFSKRYLLGFMHSDWSIKMKVDGRAVYVPRSITVKTFDSHPMIKSYCRYKYSHSLAFISCF